MRYRVCNNDIVRMSYSVTDKLKLPLLQHNDRVTSIIPGINLLVRFNFILFSVQLN